MRKPDAFLRQASMNGHAITSTYDSSSQSVAWQYMSALQCPPDYVEEEEEEDEVGIVFYVKLSYSGVLCFPLYCCIIFCFVLFCCLVLYIMVFCSVILLCISSINHDNHLNNN